MRGVREGYVGGPDGLRLFFRDHPGPAGRVPVVCLHGLTRNGADFEDVAPRLAAAGRRVLVPDVRGRGRSGRAADPDSYRLPVYVADLRALLAAEGIGRCIVVGTSMGGLIGMMFGAAAPDMLAGLVLNDIGPEIDPAGLARIAGYAGRLGPVRDWPAAIAATREINAAALPDLGEEDWARFARRTWRAGEDGLLRPDHDPAIARGLSTGGAAPPDLWPLFDALAGIPVLVLRGETSDILAADTVRRMRRRHPGCEAVDIPGRGHAPTLDEPDARAALATWLAARD